MTQGSLAELWVKAVSEASGFEDPERKLIESLAHYAMGRWRGRSDGTEEGFLQLYEREKDAAQEWITAVVYMARELSDGATGAWVDQVMGIGAQLHHRIGG